MADCDGSTTEEDNALSLQIAGYMRQAVATATSRPCWYILLSRENRETETFFPLFPATAELAS